MDVEPEYLRYDTTWLGLGGDSEGAIQISGL
jgi:hypothetical protein